jgi:hypothetical protein
MWRSGFGTGAEALSKKHWTRTRGFSNLKKSLEQLLKVLFKNKIQPTLVFTTVPI